MDDVRAAIQAAGKASDRSEAPVVVATLEAVLPAVVAAGLLGETWSVSLVDIGIMLVVERGSRSVIIGVGYARPESVAVIRADKGRWQHYRAGVLDGPDYDPGFDMPTWIRRASEWIGVVAA